MGWVCTIRDAREAMWGRQVSLAVKGTSVVTSRGAAVTQWLPMATSQSPVAWQPPAIREPPSFSRCFSLYIHVRRNADARSVHGRHTRAVSQWTSPLFPPTTCRRRSISLPPRYLLSSISLGASFPPLTRYFALSNVHLPSFRPPSFLRDSLSLLATIFQPPASLLPPCSSDTSNKISVSRFRMSIDVCLAFYSSMFAGVYVLQNDRL